MIESYLRANKLFVDYNEVGAAALFFLPIFKYQNQPFRFEMHLLINIPLFQPQSERVYSSYLELNLSEVEPCMSGPKRFVFFNVYFALVS